MKPENIKAWKDQIIMTVELAKFKSAEPDDEDLGGDNSGKSNDIARFTFALDDTGNRAKYEGGLIGGDLPGFRSKVPYLKSLGISTLVIYPITESCRNNLDIYLPTGYGVRDFTKIDPNFRGAGEGSEDYSSYINLIRDLHDPEIGGYRVNVLQDVSLSMCGREHAWFNPFTSADATGYFKKWDPMYSKINKDLQEGLPFLFEHKVSINLNELFNEDAFSYNDKKSDGSLGDTGHTLPAEQMGCMLPFVDVYGNEIFFEFGSKLNGNMNALRGKSEEDVFIPVPAAKYSLLALALTATAPDCSPVFRICYEDGTYTDNKVSAGQYDSESKDREVLFCFDHMHREASDVLNKAFIYCTSLQLDTTKKITGISLLKGEAARCTHIFSLSGNPVIHPLKIDLSEYYNADGISSDSNKGDGKLGNSGILFPAESLAAASCTSCVTSQFKINQDVSIKVNFALGPWMEGRLNLVRAEGQTVHLEPEKYHRFALAAFSQASDQAWQKFIVNYADGSSSVSAVTVKSMISESLTGKHMVVLESDHAHTKSGNEWIDDASSRLRVFGYMLDADAGKEAVSITLPNNPEVYIAAINPMIFIASAWGMPMLDHTGGISDNSGLFNYFWENVLKFWMELSDIDGYRIDSAQSFHIKYWRTFVNEYWKKYFPGKLLFAEAAVEEPSRRKPHAGPKETQLHREQYVNSADDINFDGIYDLELSEAIRETFAKDMPSNSDAYSLIPVSVLWDEKYEKPWNQSSFFDVYENFPFLKEINADKYPAYSDKLPKIKLAAAFVMSINRVPLLFSGNEYLLNYGAYEDPETNAVKPGYLFSSEVRENPVYQDNLQYMKALINMRNGSPALRSEERMTNEKWLLQGEKVFGFIRQEKGSPSIVALFNNSPELVEDISVSLPSGVGGSESWNFILGNNAGVYGADDPTITWPTAGTMRISSMKPWEAKLIRIQK